MATLRWISGGVTAALGFRASGVSAGIKRSRKPDLSLVVSDTPAVCAATFTTNRVKAAPVLISMERVRRGTARAILLNSGCANCMTGRSGHADALTLGRRIAQVLGVSESQVLLASTGMIGRRVPVPRMVRKMPALVETLSRQGHRNAALGILTTDLRAKEAAMETRLDGRWVRLGGMVKGSGMIAPTMATMLCVLTTDAVIDRGLLTRLLREAVARSFNRITVDGDMSTNDTVFALAGGASGVRIRAGTRQAAAFAEMLSRVTQRLAAMLVEDGEGVTRLALVEVIGAKTESDAVRCARQIANSPLVKTMLAGGDPNVGRVAAAAGASGARFDPNRLELRVDGVPVVLRGEAQRLSKALAKQLLTPKTVTLQVHLHAGPASARMLTCDFTEDYVRINARYST